MIDVSRRTILLAMAAAAYAFAQKDTVTGAARIVAVGDIHGDFAAMQQVLTTAGLIDAKGLWSGGKTHLVQIGDLPDRGPDTKRVIEYLIELQKQARKAGGAVHVLIGNHDAMNVYGDLRYVSAAEYREFVTPKSEKLRESYIKVRLEREAPADPAAAKAKIEKETPLGWVEHRRAWEPSGEFGKWTASHPAVLKVNDTLFVHAGLSPAYAAKTIEEINKAVREELTDFAKLQGGVAMAEDGPLWWRGLAQGAEEQLSAHVDTLLKNFGVARIVIGHTPTKAPIAPRFGGRVWNVDTGLSAAYGGPKDALIIEGAKVTTLLGK